MLQAVYTVEAAEVVCWAVTVAPMAAPVAALTDTVVVGLAAEAKAEALLLRTSHHHGWHLVGSWWLLAACNQAFGKYTRLQRDP